jgi:hypothetical protein
MALYQKSVLNKYLKQLETAKVDKAYKKYANHFLNPTIQENIRNSKEEEYQGIFLTDLFVNVLDYTLKPNVNFNLVAEYKNQTNSRKADGAILFDNKATGVIELKGTNTKDLESIRKQAFDYKANQKECIYVITSNYEKLRFYINDATEFEEFNLFELTREEFDLLYLCLHKDNIENNIPLKIKEASLLEEEQITKKFYKDYSLFKRELYRDLVKRNTKRIKNNLSKISTDANEADLDEETKAELLKLEKNVKLNLFKKSQKLIDRFLFVFFAEDRGLLPPNSTLQILNKWKDDIDFGDDRPLYDMFKQYFKFLDIGRQGTTNRAEIYAYNGGLFKEDVVLDQLEIDNDLLFNHCKKLASYDFESQVDVNILGHIFENSLNEIESVNAEIEGGDFDKQKSKRKKDGVFYTPKYITKYIVENTIGKLCDEKKNELGFKEEEYFKGRKNRQQTTIIKLVEILDTYRDWLLQLTICDPACGSGAFLNQALDFLIKEHNYIDELKAKILGGGLVFSDIENTILENNIYGVDLNEESVEIAKLSLWLRTAQPRRKLNNLNSNIKCGNSLIDSKTIAGDKAFNWQEQFPKVFEKGGFDVIIGNPPYVQLQKMKDESEKIKKLGYKTFESTGDLYCLFYELGNIILKENGLLGFITSNKWLRANYGKSLRNYLIDNTQPIELIDLGSGIFESATVDSNILVFKKTKNNKKPFVGLDITKEKIFIDFTAFEISKILINPKDTEIWNISNNTESNIIKKIEKIGTPLKDWNIKINRGVLTGYNEAFIIDEIVKQKLINEDNNNLELIKPILAGKDINRYKIQFDNSYIITTFPSLKININNFPSLKKYFESFGKKIYQIGETFINEKGLKNTTRKKTSNKWFETQDSISYYKDYLLPKIFYREISTDMNAVYTENEYYTNNKAYIITGESLKYLCVFFNSKLFNKIILSQASNLGGKGEAFMNSIFVPKLSEINQIPFIEKSDLMQTLNNDFQEKNTKFTKYLQSQFAIEKITKKLENWYELDFGDFIKEMNKAIKVTNKERVKNELQPIKELTKLDEMDWMDVFETKKAEAQNLKQQINSTDKEIDSMVYELYGLSVEEIAIVENS